MEHEIMIKGVNSISKDGTWIHDQLGVNSTSKDGTWILDQGSKINF